MKKLKLILMSLWIVFTSCANAESLIEEPIFVPGAANYQLVNPYATTEAKRVFSLLSSIYGKRIVSGVVAHVDWNTREVDNVEKWTGKSPVLNTFDFINIHASKDVNPNGWLDYSDMSPVFNWADKGGLVGCMWHWQVRANNGTDMTCSPGSKPGETSFDPACIDNPQSTDYKQLLHDLDQVAGYLRRMQQKGIPVIWRPLHEAAGNTYEFEGGGAWFWWGAKGPAVYKKLWRFVYDYLVNHHKLNNLIWVWNSQMGDRDWYPGDDVVDVVGRDSYYALQYPLMKEYMQLSAEYPNKIIALAECGSGDEVSISLLSKIWKEGSRWSWFMTWYDYDYNEGNSDSHKFADEAWWKDAMAMPEVVDREEWVELLKNIK